MFPSLILSLFNSLLASPLITFILAVWFGFLGLLLSAMFRDKLKLDKKIRNRPSVPGKITSSQVKEKESFRQGTRAGNTPYVPLVKYSYTVTGTLYHGERIGNTIYSGITRGAPKRMVKRFPAGATVPVYYYPIDPSEAVLEKTMQFNTVGLFTGIGACIVSVFFVGIWIYNLLPKD